MEVILKKSMNFIKNVTVEEQKNFFPRFFENAGTIGSRTVDMYFPFVSPRGGIFHVRIHTVGARMKKQKVL